MILSISLKKVMSPSHEDITTVFVGRNLQDLDPRIGIAPLCQDVL